MSTAEIDDWINDVKAQPGSAAIGMILSHQGIVCGASRSGEPMHGMMLSADSDRLERALSEARTWPGVFAVRAGAKEGSLSVGDEIMKVLVAGANRDNMLAALQRLVSLIKIDYDAGCDAQSTLEMITRITGRGRDTVIIRETGRLSGEGARAVLSSYLSLRDDARAEVYNTLSASAPHARGHGDCKEIVQHRAVAKAVPIVEVSHPLAHITHEAAIGSVDSRQLQTLMSRGLTGDEATHLIIGRLLS